LLASFPEKQRSIWFYDSTFIGQRNFYKSNLQIINISEEVRNAYLELSDYLSLFGWAMLVRECYFIKIYEVERWINSLNMPESEIQKYKHNKNSILFQKLKLNCIYYFYRAPSFILRYGILFLNFIITSLKR
jgi:hypothetical protein